MVYLRGPDPVQHYAWDLVEPEKYAIKPAHLERDRGIVEGIYRYVDSFLLEVLDAVDSGTTVIVVSDHGAEPARVIPETGRRPRPGGHTNAAKGVLFIRGPHVKPGEKLTSATPLDIVPTMAWLLGPPLAAELEGRILSEAFEGDFVASQPIREVESYGAREAKAGLASPEDEALLHQLRSLGYIE
jgi:arylsulfatase A-like enzyme